MDVKMWGGQLWLFVALFFCLLVAGVGTVVCWTLLKMRWARKRAARAETERRAGRLDGNGRPRPPAARGLCERCGRLDDEIRFLPDGRRLCPRCCTVEIDADAGYDRGDTSGEKEPLSDKEET